MRSFEGSIRTLVLVGLITILTLATRHAAAAPITWESPVAINTNDPSQVITAGTLVAQGEQRSPSQTVNGVTFGPLFPNVGSVNVTVSNATGGVAGAFGPDDTTYAKLVSAGIYRATGGNADIQISGLTSGTAYDVQLFTPFWDANYETSFSDGTTSVAMGNTGLQPTYVIGHFTAGATTQDIFFTAAGASSFGLFAAIEVRVPEPASAALFGLAALALHRRGKRAV